MARQRMCMLKAVFKEKISLEYFDRQFQGGRGKSYVLVHKILEKEQNDKLAEGVKRETHEQEDCRERGRRKAPVREP